MEKFDRIVVVTKKTALEELVERFGTREQARFYLEHSGVEFEEYDATHRIYKTALQRLEEAVPKTVRSHYIERQFLPNYTFGPRDLVVALGPDGLTVNIAKYLDGQPLLAFNPDWSRIDGVLAPFPVERAVLALPKALRGEWRIRQIGMARATLNDGQVLEAVNDLFVGQATHASALYRIGFAGRAENQSSSGIIVSTGAGSTGWLKSIVTGSLRTMQSMLPAGEEAPAAPDPRFDWEAQKLVFHVREPFISRNSEADLAFGTVTKKTPLVVTSRMPQNGVIFSDGIEADYLQFNSGATARIEPAERKLRLMVPN